MVSVYVLRLRSAELAEGRLVGEVEEVESGGTALIHSIEELIGFVTRRPQDGGASEHPGTETEKGYA